MSERSFMAAEYAQHRAAIALILIIVVPMFCAGWLNGLRLYAFPLGTFLVALIIPVALIAVAFIAPRAVEDEPDQP